MAPHYSILNMSILTQGLIMLFYTVAPSGESGVIITNTAA